MHYFLPSIAGIISFMALDYLWLAVIAKDFYLTKLKSHVTIENGSLVPYLPAVPLVYLVAIVAIWVFVLSQAKTGLSAFGYGALLGFLMYALYDFTNLATLRDYSWSIAIVDSIWGAFIMGTVALLMFLVKASLA